MILLYSRLLVVVVVAVVVYQVAGVFSSTVHVCNETCGCNESLDNKPSHSMCGHLAIEAGTKIIHIQ